MRNQYLLLTGGLLVLLLTGPAMAQVGNLKTMTPISASIDAGYQPHCSRIADGRRAARESRIAGLE